ncbi:hypothetical protein PV733_22515 [Streptomyces europaeiscabiei]|uniref:hypothetical protein n=1 Tax=Streptomyces europaeiscabiei TaxID=146819 RepID=UPI0013C48318|nr:hypothetical protein [Streptomyces europaeiscabiei]MDX3711670.1 hypothetical protein [Streptomyces europaeiscabiei]
MRAIIASTHYELQRQSLCRRDASLAPGAVGTLHVRVKGSGWMPDCLLGDGALRAVGRASFPETKAEPDAADGRGL